MPGPLSGPGIGLPLPQNLYPSELFQAPYDWSNNKIALSGGDALPLPAGDWYVSTGSVSVLQFADPVTGTWREFASARGQIQFVKSDGFNFRVANLTGCPVGAIVVAGGSGYVESTTTVTPSTGNSTWQAIVGGMLSVVSMASEGGNYGVAPLVAIPAPPSPGVQATAIATLSGGSISGVTLTNVGAGYASAVTATILPNPTDPNINSGITQASVVLALNASTTLASAISAVLCTNPGAPTASLPTLSVTGAGASASVNAVTLSTLLNGTISAAGAGYTNNGTVLRTFGGQPVGVPAYVNPDVQMTGYRPRDAEALLVSGTTLSTITSLGTIYDSGLFAGTPNVIISTNGAVTTVATVAIGIGTATDTITLQPAP